MFIYNGAAEPENHLKATIEVAFQLDYSTASGTYQIPVPAGYLVDDIVTIITQVFDGTPTLKIGDGDDDDGYLDNTDIAPGTAATATTPAVKRARAGGNPYANGKYYGTDDTVDFIWVKGTNPTTGVLKGKIVLSNFKKGGVPAGLTTVTPL